MCDEDEDEDEEERPLIPLTGDHSKSSDTRHTQVLPHTHTFLSASHCFTNDSELETELRIAAYINLHLDVNWMTPVLIGKVHPNMTILPSFLRPHVVPNKYEFLVKCL